MCEVESTCAKGNGMISSVERSNLSSSDVFASETQRDAIHKNTSGGEGENILHEDISSTSGDLGDRRGSVGRKEAITGLTLKSSKASATEDAVDHEGVDPFSPKEDPPPEKPQKKKKKTSDSNAMAEPDHLKPIPSSPVNAPKERRGSKSVNFKDPEIDVEVDENGTANDVFLTTSTSSSFNGPSSSSACKEDGAEKKRVITKQRSLGETNPVYRLSMKLSPNLFNIQEIPGANQHREVEKVGYLTKLSGRSFPYIPQWKRRYCVLSKGRLYYYEREDSKTGDKSNGVINLEYFDQVTEAGPKECKKATNVFIITSQDRSFFDPGRHMFSADTLPDMKDWVRKLQVALEQIRNNNRPSTTSSSTSSAKKDVVGKKGREGGEGGGGGGVENKENAQNTTKDRKKKKDSHRPRKSARVGDGPEGPSEGTDLANSSGPQREAEVSTVTSAVGIQLPGMASSKGIQLPGMTSKKERHETKDMADANPQTEDGPPPSGPTLPCVTKLRVKGPQGRRIPQNHRRTMAAAALKKRASSLSALEYQDLNDSRSESSQGTRDSSRNSKTTENDLDVVKECPSKHDVTFDDIDKDLFFSKKNISRDELKQENAGDGDNNDDAGRKDEVKRNVDVRNENEGSANAEVNSGEKQEQRNSRIRSRNSSLLGTKLSRFRETMMTMKRRRFETKEVVGHDHPDDIASSRWNCSIL